MNIEEEIADLKKRVEYLERINEAQRSIAQMFTSRFSEEEMKKAKKAFKDFEDDRK